MPSPYYPFKSLFFLFRAKETKKQKQKTPDLRLPSFEQLGPGLQFWAVSGVISGFTTYRFSRANFTIQNSIKTGQKVLENNA